MLTDKHFKELEDKGYTVVENVISKADCDHAVNENKQWLTHFGNNFPKCFNSIIKDHNVGHMETTWRLRLNTKPVFAQLWHTEKLLSSFDAIAIRRPPEDGVEEFQKPDGYWLHVDVTPSRIGLHAYQGALYLEEQTKNDWTFLVMEGSHKHILKRFDEYPEKAERARKMGFYYSFAPDDVDYFKSMGCRLTRVPVGKGGMALWDSRLVHANARPLPKRKHAGRWRYVAFISMTPAIWANEVDIAVHQEAYKKPTLTTHWSSQGVRVLQTSKTPWIPFPDTVPDIARTEEALQLSGMVPYDFEDGKPNGDSFTPSWRKLEAPLAPELDLERHYANGHI
ncbi:uncharacterized protein LOC127862545 [Dreissena polymorpha]|uniref:Phytanoyl-CoA dioxygenase n=1 Tax=Dreissena polymorpha TaxID=45954 RepID=A0A9D4BJ79_DREPO|nr:uncharacterized protein LOC127862545 [Dreissena polymorpha]XP_052257670.1 uncharacterized protein LOC127862545 [Dreissena polymorpha]XP_052257671.1 uncharacterized protein LOC127862545 [Dreissena polymorpha]KAH3695378.1 hypothetical protein DPMN_082835 [Dreissena polymorpha]